MCTETLTEEPLMMTPVLSHPATRLAVLTLTTTILSFSQIARAADEATSAIDAPTGNLSLQLTQAVFSPLSRLVESPYADPTVLDNPLGVPARSAAKVAVIHSMMTRDVPVSAAPGPISAFDAEAEKPVQRIELTPLEFTEESSTTLSPAGLVHPTPPSFGAALAMSSR
jgi:hypothetical protein